MYEAVGEEGFVEELNAGLQVSHEGVLMAF